MSKHLLPNLWAYARPAEDVPGQWEAHCLDLDVVTMGNSLQHALLMLFEAVGIVCDDDFNAGRDPLERRAPEAEWEPMWSVFKSGCPHPITSPDELVGISGEVVLQFTMELHVLPVLTETEARGPQSIPPERRPARPTFFTARSQSAPCTA